MNERDLLCCAESSRLKLGIHRTTWGRWRNGQSRIPRAAIVALQALAGEIFADGWEGWRFGRDGALYDPTGIRHTAGTIEAWQWLRQALDALKAGERVPGKDPAGELRAELYRRLQTRPPGRSAES